MVARKKSINMKVQQNKSLFYQNRLGLVHTPRLCMQIGPPGIKDVTLLMCRSLNGGPLAVASSYYRLFQCC